MDVYNYYNGRLGLVCFVFYLILLFRGRKTLTSKIQQSNNFWFVFICIAIYSVLGFLEYDTYHYYSLYEDMYSSGYKIHVEGFYYWLIEKLPHSYLLWRFVIWCSASLLLIFSAKFLNINPYILAFFTPLLLLRNISMTRESLGICLMIFSSLVLISSFEKKKVLLIILSLIGIIASSFLHKTMIVFIGLLFLSYFIPMNKRVFIISLILFPILYSLSLKFFINFVPLQLMNEEQSSIIVAYQETGKSIKNFNGILFDIFEKGTLLLFLFIITKKYVYDKIEVSRAHFSIYKYAYLMVYVSFLFYGQEISNWISYRVLHVGYFALALCACHCFDTNVTLQNRNTLESVAFVLLIIVSLYNTVPFIISYW